MLSLPDPVCCLSGYLCGTDWQTSNPAVHDQGTRACSAPATWSAHHAVDWDSTTMLGHQRNYTKEKSWNLSEPNCKLDHFIEAVDQCHNSTTRCFMLRSPTDYIYCPCLFYNYKLYACMWTAPVNCVHCH